MTIALLNTSILTAYGSYDYEPISLETARALVRMPMVYQSYIGHESTAQLLSTLLGVEVPMNRQSYRQEPGDIALALKLNRRAPEGTILGLEEIQALGYELGVIRRLA